MLGDQFRGKAADRVGVHNDGLGIVLRLVASAAGLTGDNKDAFAGGGPVGRTLAGDLAIGDETLGVADLVGGRVANHEVGIVCRRVFGDIGIEELFLRLTAGLAFVEGDQHGDRRVQGFGEDDIVQFGVVVAIHVEIKGYSDTRQDIFKNVVDVVAADVEKMEHLARVGVIGLFLCVLREFGQLEAGKVLVGIEGVACGSFYRFCHEFLFMIDRRQADDPIALALRPIEYGIIVIKQWQPEDGLIGLVLGAVLGDLESGKARRGIIDLPIGAW